MSLLSGFFYYIIFLKKSQKGSLSFVKHVFDATCRFKELKKGEIDGEAGSRLVAKRAVESYPFPLDSTAKQGALSGEAKNGCA